MLKALWIWFAQDIGSPIPIGRKKKDPTDMVVYGSRKQNCSLQAINRQRQKKNKNKKGKTICPFHSASCYVAVAVAPPGHAEQQHVAEPFQRALAA